MSGVSEVFAKARADNRGVLVGYLPVGFPDVPGSVDAMRAMVDAGVDVVEIGVPYSDPVMDGPTIQAAAEQALRGGVRIRDVFTAANRNNAAIYTLDPRGLGPRGRDRAGHHGQRGGWAHALRAGIG